MNLVRFSYSTLAAAIMATGMTGTVLAQEQRMSDVVVTASGFEQAVEDAPASVTVIPREELEKKAYRDVTDALRDVPGVVITGGGSSSDISLRGMEAKYTMLLVDGRRQNSRETRPNSDGSGIEQGWLPPISAIERIEVVRGPMSSLYGSDAMGGVINIITRKVAKQWTGSVRAEATQQASSQAGDMYQGSFYLSGPIQTDVMGLQISGAKSHRSEDKFLNGFNRQDTESVNAKLSLTPNKDHDIELEVGRTLQNRIASKGKSSNSDSNGDYDKTLYALSHTARLGFGTLKSYVQQEDIDNVGRNMFVKNTEINSQLTMPLGGGRHLTTVGVSYKNEELLDNGNKLGVVERDQWALFAENEWSVTDALALTAGLRMNEDENYGRSWTPRLYGVWKASDTLSLKGGVSTGFKAPGLRQTIGQGTGGGGDPAWIVGNPNLQPEKSVSQELGFIWDNRSNLNFSVMAFNSDVKNKIVEERICNDTLGGGSSIITGNCQYRGQTYKFLSQLFNVDEANMRGLEASATWQINSDFRLASNYTFTRSEQKSGKFNGQPLNKMPRHMVNATLDWKATSNVDAWTRLNFRSKTSDYLSRTSMAKATPSFAFVDMGLNYKLAKDVKLSAGIYNILDKKVDNALYGAQYDGRRYWVNVTAGF